MTYYKKSDKTLGSITIPYGYTSISDNAFYKYYNLSSITIPTSIIISTPNNEINKYNSISN